VSCGGPRQPWRQPGFTLIEVLVALVIVAIGLAALMITVSSTARTSGSLRDKTLAEWIALNRISEVRLNLPKTNGQNVDAGEIYFANRTWHYDTRYFDTSVTTMKRIVVRVYGGDAKTKGNPLAESTGFLGSALSAAGNSNTADWTTGSTQASAVANASSAATTTGVSVSGAATPTTNGQTTTTPQAPAPTPTTTPAQ
jgi:general secretion pathway protein I